MAYFNALCLGLLFLWYTSASPDMSKIKTKSDGLCSESFTFNNEIYTGRCADMYGNGTWYCYVESGKIGECVAPTGVSTIDENKKCVFPFEIDGITYHSCINSVNTNLDVYECGTISPVILADQMVQCSGSNYGELAAKCGDYVTGVAKSKNPTSTLNTVTGLSLCKTICSGDDTCAAIDVDTSGKCYIVSDTQLSSTLTTDSTFTHYVKSKCSTTPAPTTLSCADQYTSVSSQSSSNGAIITGATTVASCKTNCNAISTCVGFDFVTASTKCYFHTTSTFTTKNTGSTGTTQYIRGTCAETTVDCASSYSNTAKVGSYQGTEVTTTSTVAGCKTVCNAEATCVGFDYNTGSSKCYWHTSATIGSTFVGEKSTQYIKGTCTTTTSTTTVTTTGPSTSTTAVTTTAPSTATSTATSTVTSTVTTTVATTATTTASTTTAVPTTIPAVTTTVPTKASTSTPTPTSTVTTTVAPTTVTTTVAPTTVAPTTVTTLATSTSAVTTPTSTASTAAASTATATSAATTACVDNLYTEVANTLSYDGTEKASANTVDLCKAECTTSSTKCYAFDFTPAKKCFIHLKADFQSNRNDAATGVTQYVKVFLCPCVDDQFEKVANTLSYAGIGVTANSLDTCKTECVNYQTKCYAFDISVKNLCYIHTDVNFKNDAYTADGVDQYRRLFSCPCSDTFSMTPNTKGFGAELFTIATTANTCQLLCLSKATCIAFEFNRSFFQCWIYTAAVGTLVANTNIDIYVRVTCITSSTTEASTAATTVTTATPPGNCAMGTKTENKMVFGGVEIGSFTVEADCVSACLMDAKCLSIDWNKNSGRCYAHYTVVDATSVKDNNCCNRYDKICPGN